MGGGNALIVSNPVSESMMACFYLPGKNISPAPISSPPFSGRNALLQAILDQGYACLTKLCWCHNLADFHGLNLADFVRLFFADFLHDVTGENIYPVFVVSHATSLTDQWGATAGNTINGGMLISRLVDQ